LQQNLAKPIVSISPTGNGKGYRLLTADGIAIPYGDAAR
jgi:hypothetical protein